MRMPRERSISGFYHSMVQGINKQDIFLDNDDRYFFLSLLSKYSIKYRIELNTYVLMDNHIHMLLHDNENKISNFMQTVTSIYARFFNKKYDRIGHLFNDRFTSKPVEDTNYLQECFSYIINNPEKAGIAKKNEYKWSSYHAYKSEKTFISKQVLIDSFGSIKKLYEYLHKNQPTGNFIKPREIPSEKKRNIIRKICEIFQTSSPVIPQDISKETLKIKIRQLINLGISKNAIIHITGLSQYIVNQC